MSSRRSCPFCNGTGVYRDPTALVPRELRWTLASDSVTGSHVTMVGELTEQANLESLAALPQPVVLDLSGIRYLNTMGSHSLVRLVEALGTSITAERCSPALVRQLNLMPALSDRLRVRSALVPYECEACNTEQQVVVELAGRRPAARVCRCGTCGGLLKPDESNDLYFGFLPV